jgi:hypothetical protein
MPIAHWSWDNYIAAYAAVVATGALALEVRRWFEGGVRLRIDAAPGMVLVNVPGVDENQPWVVVTVSNIGFSPATITGLGVVRYRSRRLKLCRKAIGQGIVLTPDLPGCKRSLPKMLAPGEQWKGFMKQTPDIETQIVRELFYMSVWSSDRARARVRRVFLRKNFVEKSQ